MVWLALGSMPLLLAGLRARRRRLDALSAIAFICLLAAAAGSLERYPWYRAATGVGGGLLAGLLLCKLDFDRVAVRLAFVAAGVAASAFALFGPAGGLF
jgi:hypothetical protein